MTNQEAEQCGMTFCSLCAWGGNNKFIALDNEKESVLEKDMLFFT